MRQGWTHAQAVHNPGAVCGTDNEQTTKISDDPNLIDCPDCIGWADIEALPDDATQGGPRVIELLRQAAGGAFRKIDGVPVDATTATAILTVYQAASPTTRTKIAAMRVDRMAALAWRILRPRT
jgi:hypothetical protein